MKKQRVGNPFDTDAGGASWLATQRTVAARLALLGCMLSASLAVHSAVIDGSKGGVEELRWGILQVRSVESVMLSRPEKLLLRCGAALGHPAVAQRLQATQVKLQNNKSHGASAVSIAPQPFERFNLTLYMGHLWHSCSTFRMPITFAASLLSDADAGELAPVVGAVENAGGAWCQRAQVLRMLHMLNRPCYLQMLEELAPVVGDPQLQAVLPRMRQAATLGEALVALQLAAHTFDTSILEVRIRR